MISRLTIIFMAFFICVDSEANPYQNAKWELISNEDSVEVYSAEIEDNDIRGVKGVFTMPYNCAYVFSVIMDSPRSFDWVDRIISSEIIEQRAPHKHLVYLAMETPFPFDDREFIYEREYSFDDDNDSIFVTMRSVPYEKDENDRLRATIHYSSQLFTSTDEGESCLVESQTHADPGGYIPAWIVNIYQTDWPMNTSLALKEELKKGPSKLHPEVSQQIDTALEIDSSTYANFALTE